MTGGHLREPVGAERGVGRAIGMEAQHGKRLGFGFAGDQDFAVRLEGTADVSRSRGS